MTTIRRDTGGRRRRRHPSPGFTLIEIIIVVAIMGIMLAIAVPRFAKIFQRWQLKSYASEIQSTLLAARMTAVKRNRAVGVSVIPAAAGETWHQLLTSVPPTPGPAAQTLLLPVMKVELKATPEGGAVTFGGDGRILAPPAPPAPSQIVIQAPVGAPTPNQITIQTDQSGRVRVITPDVWY